MLIVSPCHCSSLINTNVVMSKQPSILNLFIHIHMWWSLFSLSFFFYKVPTPIYSPWATCFHCLCLCQYSAHNVLHSTVRFLGNIDLMHSPPCCNAYYYKYLYNACTAMLLCTLVLPLGCLFPFNVAERLFNCVVVSAASHILLSHHHLCLRRMCCTHLHNQWQTLRYYFQSLPPTWHFPLHELDQQQQSSPWRQ